MYSTDIPAPQGQPARHGLVDTAPRPSNEVGLGDRWEIGFAFTPESCDEPESWVIPCVGNQTAGGPGASITENRGNDALLEWTPFQVRASFKCDAQQLGSVDFQARARRIFELGESKLIESELWRGDAAGAVGGGTNLSLSQAGVTNLSTVGPAAPAIALRALIQAAAGSAGGQRCMIHATPETAMAWIQGGGIKEDREGKLVTCVGGHWVVAGSGYTGSAPGNIDPTTADTWHWAYITTPVHVLQGAELEVVSNRRPDIIDREANDAEVIVQRTAIAYWDGCLHAGLPVNTHGTVI